jgi:sensor domain CHASE-containing protein/class 3 adenylate cyclase
MNIRQKTLLLISLTLSGLIIVIILIFYEIFIKSFTQIEKQNTEKNVERVQEYLTERVNELNSTTKDWARWDDTYNFVKAPNQNYKDKNLFPSAFETLQINLMLFYNSQNKSVLNLAYDFESGEFVPVSRDLNQYLTPNSILLNHKTDQDELTGLLLVQQGFLLIASLPILTSERTGPRSGTLIMGRLINQSKVEEIAQRTKLSLIFHRVDQITPDLMRVFQELTKETKPRKIIVEPINQDKIAGYSLLKDVNGKPIILLQVTLERDIYRQGQIALLSLTIALLIVGLFFELITIILINRLILNKLIALSNDVIGIGLSNDLAMRVQIQGQDELTNFAVTINWMLDELEKEKHKTEKLLLNVLPHSIAEKLKNHQGIIAESFDDVTILFADLVGFTSLAGRLSPLDVVNFLNNIFSSFDRLAEKYGLEKIKTIGDAYMVASGLPNPRPDHAEAIAGMALEMQGIIREMSQAKSESFTMRIGINTGRVVAGVIGTKKFSYDLWGDAVNVASRMESSGEPGKIQVSETTYEVLKDKYIFQPRGLISVKGKGEMLTYWLIGKKLDLPWGKNPFS